MQDDPFLPLNCGKLLDGHQLATVTHVAGKVSPPRPPPPSHMCTHLHDSNSFTWYVRIQVETATPLPSTDHTVPIQPHQNPSAAISLVPPLSPTPHSCDPLPAAVLSSSGVASTFPQMAHTYWTCASCTQTESITVSGQQCGMHACAVPGQATHWGARSYGRHTSHDAAAQGDGGWLFLIAEQRVLLQM